MDKHEENIRWGEKALLVSVSHGHNDIYESLPAHDPASFPIISNQDNTHYLRSSSNATCSKLLSMISQPATLCVLAMFRWHLSLSSLYEKDFKPITMRKANHFQMSRLFLHGQERAWTGGGRRTGLSSS